VNKKATQSAPSKKAAAERGGNPPLGMRRTGATPNASTRTSGGAPIIAKRIGKK